MNRRPLIAGNWKMHGLQASLAEVSAVAAAAHANAELVLCPPLPLLIPAADRLRGSGVALGGQDCHALAQGAHTGDVSAEMLADAGCTYVVVGHSERRADGGETDATACAKVLAAERAGLTAILCVGETAAERAGGRAEAIVAAMLDASLPHTRRPVVVAYEPVWAIGSGRVPQGGEVAAMHAALQSVLRARGVPGRVLYGGSVKPDNAAALLAIPGVDGVLVGAASLKADSFLAIADAAPVTREAAA